MQHEFWGAIVPHLMPRSPSRAVEVFRGTQTSNRVSDGSQTNKKQQKTNKYHFSFLGPCVTQNRIMWTKCDKEFVGCNSSISLPLQLRDGICEGAHQRKLLLSMHIDLLLD
mmetsp:Transcript_42649/g.88832  ORF Transcript_42649/g.88832 Transcript_42649/m.88832 type:complete len:111 (+) Transcript_42649:801-1133(+)